MRFRDALRAATKFVFRTVAAWLSKAAPVAPIKSHEPQVASPTPDNWPDARNKYPSGVFVEIDDLLDYLYAHKAMSGIQRVQAGIINHICNSPLRGNATHYYFVIRKEIRGEMTTLNIAIADVIAIMSYASSRSVDHTELRKMIAAANMAAVEIEVSKTDIYLILGAFWVGSGAASRYLGLREKGVIIVVYIHDIISITHPGFFEQNLCRDFLLSLAEGFALFSYIVTVSEFTASQVRLIQDEHNLRRIPVKAVPLAHSLFSLPDNEVVKTPTAGVLRSGVRRALKTNYVLSVSTIEVRKNHILLIRQWQKLIIDGRDVPDLIFVGRLGWHIDELLKEIKSTEYLNGKLHLMHDLSDAELDALYEGCLFTIFPSFAEGWGLPVGESLAKGRPCVASNAASIPEVGGDFADYFDPANCRDGAAVIERMIYDHAYRKQRETNIKENFVARTWDDVGGDFLKVLETVKPQDDVPYAYLPRLDPGEVLHPVDLRQDSDVLNETYISRPFRLFFGNDWHTPDDLGVRFKRGTGRLLLATRYSTHQAIIVNVEILGDRGCIGRRIELRGAPAATGRTSQAGGLGRQAVMTTVIGDGGRQRIMLPAVTDEFGVLELSLSLAGSANLAGRLLVRRRRADVRLVSVSYSKATDVDNEEIAHGV